MTAHAAMTMYRHAVALRHAVAWSLIGPILPACLDTFDTTASGSGSGSGSATDVSTDDGTENASMQAGSTGSGTDSQSTDASGDSDSPQCRYGASGIVFASTRAESDVLAYSLYRFDFTGGSTTRLTDSAGSEIVSDLSPDGETIVVVSDRGGASDLWTLPAEGGELTRIAATAIEEVTVQWLDDGSGFLTFARDGADNDIFRVSLDGTAVQPIVTGPERDIDARASHDGAAIVFAREETDFFYQLYRANADGSAVQIFSATSGSAVAPSWSPTDGSIVFVQLLGPYGIFKVDADGTNVVQLAPDDVAGHPRFSPDAMHVAFSTQRYSVDALNDPDDPYDEIIVIDLAGTEVERVTTSPGRDRAPIWIPC